MQPSTAAEPAAPRCWGLLAQYADVTALLTAARTVREAGYRRWDCYTPFPVHGLDRAMGIRRTVLPWLVLGGGLAGLAIALGMQWYVNSPQTTTAETGVLSGYALVFSGKPFWSLPANIPIAFELTVLLSALTAFFGLWGLIRLPRLHHPLFASRRFRHVTDDGLFLAIEAGDQRFDAFRTKELLAATQTIAIEEIED
jgi:hypothetical protein